MRAVLQRVSRAAVTIRDGAFRGIRREMGPGLLVLTGIAPGDDEETVQWMARKIIGLRIFPDEAGHMNRSLAETGGACMVVSQFTLYADCKKGRRPSFQQAADPKEARPLCDRLADRIRAEGITVHTGEFGADMGVELVNDGPVTILLDSEIQMAASKQ